MKLPLYKCAVCSDSHDRMVSTLDKMSISLGYIESWTTESVHITNGPHSALQLRSHIKKTSISQVNRLLSGSD